MGSKLVWEKEKAALETLGEDEEYNWVEVKLPSLLPSVPKAFELERETGERRRGRDIIVAIDHGPNSKHAFDWALIHLCRMADTVHLVHAVSDMNNDIVYEMTQGLMEKLAVEALQVAMVKTVARIVKGDPAKLVCHEADRIKPAAVVLGTRGRGIIQSLLQGSVGEYCFHHCKVPVIIVPGKANNVAELAAVRKLLQFTEKPTGMHSSSHSLIFYKPTILSLQVITPHKVLSYSLTQLLLSWHT